MASDAKDDVESEAGRASERGLPRGSSGDQHGLPGGMWHPLRVVTSEGASLRSWPSARSLGDPPFDSRCRLPRPPLRQVIVTWEVEASLTDGKGWTERSHERKEGILS